ncbi:MAG: hypothetical protein ACM30I_17205 [Gemmatimonas sp.]
MVRQATRRSPTSSKRTARTKTTTRKTRRAFDPKRLPYAAEAQTVTDVFNFLTQRLPDFIAEEFDRLDVARSESELFRALSSLPDSVLRKAGLRRQDLPRYILSAFHFVNMAKGRKRRARTRRPAARRAA